MPLAQASRDELVADALGRGWYHTIDLGDGHVTPGAVAPGGRLIVVEPVRLILSVLQRRTPAAQLEATCTDFNWWVPNLACLRAWLTLAGFERIERRALFRLEGVKPIRQWCAALEAVRS